MKNEYDENERLLQSEFIPCVDCGTKLVEICISETNQERLDMRMSPKFMVYTITNCPNCGGKSVPTDVIFGTSSVGTLDDYHYLEPVYTEEVDDTSIKDPIYLEKNCKVISIILELKAK